MGLVQNSFKLIFLAVLVALAGCQTNQVLQTVEQSNGPLASRFPVGSSVDLIGGFQATQSETQGDRTTFVSDIQFEGEWSILCPVGLEAANTHLAWPKNTRVRVRGVVQSQQKRGLILKTRCTLTRIPD